MRARNIKPSFFTNDILAECEPLARILFAGLWTVSDREGRLEDRPKKIKAEVLPYDNCDADSLLQQLSTKGFILRYESDGCKYIQINRFVKHQNPHHMEIPSQIPAPEGFEDKYKHSPIGVPQRRRIYERDKHKCQLCKSKDHLHIDHIIPVSKGGTSDDNNLRTLCHACNLSKGNRENISPKRQEYINGKMISSKNHHEDTAPHPTDSPISDSPIPQPEPAVGAREAFFQKCYDFAVEKFPDLAAKNTSTIHLWHQSGYDLETHIKPVLESAKAKGATPRSFNFFNAAIEDSAKQKMKPAPEKEKAIELTPEHEEKQYAWYKKHGFQHPKYNPEGLRQSA